MSAEKKRKRRVRTLLKGFCIDKVDKIEAAKTAMISFLDEQYLQEEYTKRLVAVLYSEKKNNKEQRFLEDFYVDNIEDIDFVVRKLKNPKCLKPYEVFTIVLFFEAVNHSNIVI